MTMYSFSWSERYPKLFDKNVGGAFAKYSNVLLFLKNDKIFFKIFILFQSIPHLRLYTFIIFVGAFVFSLQTMK